MNQHLLFLRFLPESIPWLVAVGRTKEAKIILNQAANFNKVRLPKRYRLEKEEMTSPTTRESIKQLVSLIKGKGAVSEDTDTKHSEDAKKYSALDILKSCRLLVFAVIMSYLWSVHLKLLTKLHTTQVHIFH